MEDNPHPEATTWGVGPWQGERPTGDHYDPELLDKGDSRNVVDKYRYWSMDAIIEDLNTKRHPFHVAIENWQHDLNIGSIVRSANAFLADTVHIVGRKRWNRRGAMVTDRYQRVLHHPTIEDLVAYATNNELPIVAVDNVEGSKPIETTTLPRECIILFGQEGPGLSPEALEAADMAVEITQYGSTRSLNASAAAAIIMHRWVMTHADLPES
ncbi:MAG: RNA methyltransferase [Pontimonas sp.]|nr:RNA methyltransferase [Pontimonas sp.]